MCSVIRIIKWRWSFCSVSKSPPCGRYRLRVLNNRGDKSWISGYYCVSIIYVLSLSKQTGHHFAHDIFNCIIWTETTRMSIWNWFNFVAKGQIDNLSAQCLGAIRPILNFLIIIHCIIWSVRISLIIANLRSVHGLLPARRHQATT